MRMCRCGAAGYSVVNKRERQHFCYLLNKLKFKSYYILIIFLTVFAVLIVRFELIFALAVLDHQFVFLVIFTAERPKYRFFVFLYLF